MRLGTIRTINSIAATIKFQVSSQDVRQAYLQSFEPPTRNVLIGPSKKFDRSKHDLLELLEPLY